MARKDDATQVFRQFAWNLAGTLATPKARVPRQPAKPVVRREAKR